MTTEQSDWLDDERAGRHAPKVLRGHPTEEEIAEAKKDAPFGVLIIPTEELGPYFDAEVGPNPYKPGSPGNPTKPNLVYTDRVSAQGAMAALGDPLDPMPDKWVVHVLADDDPRLFEKIKATIDRRQGDITDTTQFSEDTLRKVDAALFEAGINGVNARRDLISAMQNAGILFRERITEPEPYWVKREASEVQSPPNFEEAEEHTHHTREARDQCAAGDHQYAVLLDDAAEREKLRELIDRPQGEHPGISDEFWEKVPSADREAFSRFLTQTVTVNPEDYVTMAEEPREHAMHRQWLDGYLAGFREGFERAGWR